MNTLYFVIQSVINLINKLLQKKGEVIISKPRATDYQMGGKTLIVPVIINEKGDWKEWLSLPFESQYSKEDMSNCVSQAGINAIEAYLNYQVKNKLIPDELIEGLNGLKFFNEQGFIKLSTRFTSKMAGTTKQGLQMTAFWDSVRKDGFLPMALWQDPKTYNWNEYYSEIPQKYKDFAKNLVKIFKIQYEWVVQGNCKTNTTILKNALMLSPLFVACPSCPRSFDSIQRPCGTCQTTHSRVIYSIDELTNVLDTYPPFLTKTSNDYPAPWVIRFKFTLNDEYGIVMEDMRKIV